MEKELVSFFTANDVKRIFVRHKRTYVKAFLVVFFAVLLFYLAKTPSYTATALFKQAPGLGGESELLQSFLQETSLGTKETSVQSILESRTLLSEVIERLGLCMEIKEGFYLARKLRTARDRVSAELGCFVQDRRPIRFSRASFSIAKPIDLTIRLEENALIVFDENKQELGMGIVGSPINLPQGTFTVDWVDTAYNQQNINLRIYPFPSVLKSVAKRLKIKATKGDKNVLMLAFSTSYAEEAANFLNSLMFQYQKYLQQENEEISLDQMAYLDKRQEELTKKYEKSLQEHVAFLAQNVQDTGFISFRQERDFLEKPTEEYADRIYEIDLDLHRSRLKPKEFSSPLEKSVVVNGEKIQEIELARQKTPAQNTGIKQEGLTLELAEHLRGDYAEQWDNLRIEIEQLSYVSQQIMQPEFEILSLGGILKDSVSQEMIQKAGRIALDMQDKQNYSSKDLDRLREQLGVQKRFLSQHVLDVLKTKQMQVHLLRKKITNLESTRALLLEEEKKLLQEQLLTVQDKMKDLPEKWKREQQLVLQRDLSLGMIEGLTQLTEAKNLRYRLFQVESKPIDLAALPDRPSQIYLFWQCLFAGAFAVAGLFAMKFTRWLSLGTAITPTSAKDLGVQFCGFLRTSIRGGWDRALKEDKEALRKAAAFIFFHHQTKSSQVVTISSALQCSVDHIASLLHSQGLSVLLIECTPAILHNSSSNGLYDYLSEGMVPTITKGASFDKLSSGQYRESYGELLFRKEFSLFLEEKRSHYDVILLSVQETVTVAAVESLRPVTDLLIVEAEDVFYEEIMSWPHTAALLTIG